MKVRLLALALTGALLSGHAAAQDADVVRIGVSNDRSGMRIQPVDATVWLNRCAGVS